MRVLVAPDKFAGTLTAVEAAEAIADGLARATRPTTSSTWRRCPTAGPGSSTCCTRRSGGELLAVTVAGPFGEPVPGDVLRRRRHGVRRERPGLRPAPDRRRAAPSAATTLRRRRAAGRGARRRAPTGSWSGLGGSGTNDGGAGLLAALGATADRAARRAARPASPASPRSTSRPPRARFDGRRPGRRQRRRQPADRAVRRDQDLRPAEGHRRGAARRRVDGWLEQLAVARRPAYRRWRRAPAPPAASGFALLLLGATREPGIDARRRRGRAGRARPAPPTWCVTGEGAFDFSSRSGKVPYGVAAVAARGAAAVRRAGRAGAGRLPRDARPRRRVGVLARRPGGRGARLRRPGGRAGRARRAGRAHLVALTSTAVADARGITARCATIDRSTRPRHRLGSTRHDRAGRDHRPSAAPTRST